MRVGFMQGRLSPPVDGKIQAFPHDHWRDEFRLAAENGFGVMEWTLDHDGLDANPLMTRAGRREIRALCDGNGVAVPSATGDCFMQAPFFKAEGARHERLIDEFRRVADACAELGISFLVFPLVDDGAIETDGQEEIVVETLVRAMDGFEGAALAILFESDFPPPRLARFIARFDPARFGINYDTGNSAALGYDLQSEFAAYGPRIRNVHIKDRPLGGTTVPLGEGDADFKTIIAGLRALAYRGNLILQTARASNGDEVGTMVRYRDMAERWIRAA